jgi:hypothetical protein
MSDGRQRQKDKISAIGRFQLKTKKNGKPNLCLFIFVFFISIFLFSPGDITGLRGEEPITGTQLEVKGVSLQIDPPQQTVPINTGTTVNTTFTVDMAEVPPGMTVQGELKGPGINGTMTLSTLPNHPFAIPGFPVKGTYTLENVRLEKDGKLLVHAVPDAARIDIRDVIITEVKSRLLTLDEIREKGIVVGNNNFKVYNYSIGLQLDSEIKKFEFPMLYNSQGITIPTIGGGVGGGGISLPGMNISGFSLEMPEIDLPGLPPDEESRPQPIPGVLIFNNDVAFLNQFFSVIFIVSNNAPDNSPLTLENLTASITFPEGLREAETTPPHIPGTSIPVRCPGPDGKIGTADDLDIILATFSGMAEFLAEGLKEGPHIVKVDFAGTLSGLPIGDVPVKGSACGMVIVRNPEFSITFTHPSVVREGEEYDIFVTMTNTSPVAANLVSLTMPASRLVGTQLLGDETVSFETIGPGESETAAFHLLSLETGRIHASAFAAEGNLKGKFVLSAGVGEQGIPLSPDTLVLPDYTYSLPNSIINAAMLMLGEAYSIATTPPGGLPAHLPYIEKNIVENRAVELAEAGQRCQYGEDTVKSLQVLALDWQGNRQPNLPFDVLRRLTTKGIRFARAVAEIWNGKLTQSSPQDFHQQFAETCSYKNPFFSAVLSTHAAPRAAVLNIVDFYKNRLSVTPAGDEVTREIPYGELYLMENAGQHPVDFALVGHPDENGYTVEVLGNDTGSFDLSLVLPGSSSGLRQVSFTAVSCAPGSISTLAYNQANDTYELINDLDGNGTPDSTVQGAVVPIVEPPLELIGAVQNCTADPAGHAVALLFNKTPDPQPVKNLENFFVPGKKIYATFLQPSGRVVLVGLNNAISPFVESRIRVSDLLDTSGGLLNPSPAEKPIIATIKTPGGIVYGQVLTADGQPIANARLQLSESEGGDSLSSVTCSYVTTDSSGNYQFDYVRILKLPFILKVLDPTTGKTEQVQGKIQVNGQRFRLDIVMRGRGNIKGKVLTAQGAAVPKTYILADAENAAPLERFAAVSDDNGEFSFKDVPLGRVHLTAYQQNMTGYASTALSAPRETVTTNITMMEGKTGTIRGRVLQNDAVTPVEAAYVILVKDGKPIRAQQSDAQGYYEFAFAPVGDFIVQAYNPATNTVGGQVQGQLSENQVVEAAIIFRGYGRITGKLMAHDGTPCVNGLVFLQNTGCQAVTDSSGEFIIDDVPVGTYQMVGYNRDTYQKTYQMIELFEEGQEVRVTLVFADNQPGGISGRFYEEDGVTPVALEYVYAAQNNNPLRKTQTDENGNFSFSDLAPGSYQVFSPPPGNAASAVTSIKFPGQFVTRDITRRGRGTVIVNVFSDDGQTGIMSDVEFSQPVFRCVTGVEIGFTSEKDTYNTDANGYIRFDNVYMGNFWVKAVNPFYPEDSGHWGELTYQEEQVTVNIVMKPTKKLTGRVVSFDNATPVPDARVTLKFLYKYGRVTPPPRTSSSDENAGFVFDLMPDGPFEVIAEDQINGYKGNIIGNMNLNDDTLDVTVRLRGRGSVTGTVKNRQEEAVPNADVTLESIGFPYEKFATTSGAEGKFQFNGVTEGDFSIAVVDAASGLAGRATGKLQGNNSTVDVEVYLETSGTVTGKVWTPDMDQVVPNAQLVLFHQQDAYKAPFGFALSGADGSYRFRYIPGGSFYIEAFDPASGRKGKIQDTISSDAEIVQRDILLEGRGTVYGIFYDSTGTSPVPAASVKIKSSGLFPFEVVSNTGSGGNFEFQQIAVGDFQLEAQDPASGLIGTASGTVEYDEQSVNTNIYAESSGTVKGKTLRSDGVTPVPHAYVELVEISTGKIHSTTANETGLFTISFVRSGKFSIKATDQASRDYGTLQAEITFNGQELNLDILFKGLGIVFGHVLDGSGSPLPDMEVKLNSSDYRLRLTTGTGSSGEFRFDGLPPDLYSLTARDPVTGLSGTGGAEITTNGQEVPVDLTLESAGQVFGTIFNADGTTPADKAQVKLTGGNFNLYITADANGDFQFNTVRLGSFTLQIQGLNSSGLARAAGQLDSHGDIRHFDSIVLDNQPPAVVSVFPANGSSGVPLNTPVNIGFSEPMAPDSITASSIKLSCAGVNVPGTRVLSGDKTSVLFTPNNPLTSFALYTITVGGSVEDLAGNTPGTPAAASFTTSDTQPPAVVSVSPVNNANGIPIDAVITVIYNEPIDTTKFTLQNITLSAGITPVTGSLAFNDSHTMVTFTPVQFLTDTVYSLWVQGAVDMAGNIQAAAVSSGFSTTDTIAPVLQLLPPVGGTTVIEGSVVTVTADVGGAADIDAVYFFIEGQLKFTDKSAPFNYQFTAPLIEVLGKTNFLLEALAADRAGNQGSREHLSFTLLQDQPPLVTLAGPADTTVYPGQSFNCSVTALDDVGLKQVILTAVGGSMNFNDTRSVTGTGFSRTYNVPVPVDIQPGTSITLLAQAKDLRDYQASAPAVLLSVPEDSSAPQVSITSPSEAAHFRHTEVIQVNAQAADDLGIREVKFYLDEQLLFTDTGAPYGTTYTVPPLEQDKNVTFRAEAVDLSGKTADASVRVVLEKLVDETAPVVNILMPSDGSLVIAGEDIKFSAAATDDEGVKQVGFYVDDQLIFTGTAEPYETTYTIPIDAAAGSQMVFKAVAVDFDNKSNYDRSLVEVVTGTILPDGTVIHADDFSYDNQTIIVKQGTVTINGAHTFENVLVKENGILTHSAATITEVFKMGLTVTGKVVVGAGGMIDVKGRGYAGAYQNGNNSTYGRTLGNTTEGGSNSYSGASYGGYGGKYQDYQVSEIYGSIYKPVDPGSGGGGTSTGTPGGSGGGVLQVNTGALIVDGEILADGGGSAYRGAGSGGSIWITAVTLTGSGTIHANGGSGQSSTSSGGGGGRIAIYYQDAPDFDLTRVTAYGGTTSYNYSAQNGSAGSVYLEKKGSPGELLINNRGLDTLNDTPLPGAVSGTITALEPHKLTDANAGFTPGSLVGMKLRPNIQRSETFTIVDNSMTEIMTDPADGDMTLVAAVGDTYGLKYVGEVILENSQSHLHGSHHFENLTLLNSTLRLDGTMKVDYLRLQSGSILTHSPAGTTAVYTLGIDANDMVIDESSCIDVTGCGYLGGFSGENDSYYGRTLGNTTDGASYQYCGGSHGGFGGKSGSELINRVYGSLYEPVNPGSGGGGSGPSNPGGCGGGVLNIRASEILLDGEIRANGQDTSGSSGAGAGGSIRLEVTNLFGGGTIHADGGNSHYHAGGGGGRVAVYYGEHSNFDFTKVTAYGGLYTYTNAPAGNGSAGSVYLEQTGQAGKMVVDNRGKASYKPQVFPVINAAVITGLSSHVLENTNANYMTDSLVGMELIPNILEPEQTFTIAANSQTSITIDPADGDLTAAAVVGDTYSGKAVFPGHLIISNVPDAQMNRDVEVGSLDLVQNSSLSHASTLLGDVQYLSLRAAGKILIDAASSIDVSQRGYRGANQDGNTGQYGRTLGNVNGSYNYSGGGYGGYGGQHSTDPVNEVYGSLYYPFNGGSGGGSPSTSTKGGNGGGVLKIAAAELEINGFIAADGGGVTNSGAGSGGSIWLQLITLKGTGNIRANGGNSTNNGGGGGGRIALYYETLSGFDLSKITAYGGKNNYNYVNQNAGAGTIFLKAKLKTYGDLIIDNHGISNRENTTTLPPVGQGFNTLLEADKMVDANTAFIPGALVGMKLNPQPAGNKLFTIISNTVSEIFTLVEDGDMTLYGQTGWAYIGEHHLFNLTLKGNAHLFTLDRIQVTGTLTIEPGSTLKAENHQ